MPRPRKLQRQPKVPTYESVYDKVKNNKTLNQQELIVLAGMKKNAKDVNKRAIIKERKLMPTINEVKAIVQQVSKKKTDAEIERDLYSTVAISHILETCKLSKNPPTTKAGIYEVGQKYFELCETNVITPTSSGLARVLGLRRKELLEIVNGERNVLNKEAYCDLWQMLEMYDEAMMKQGKINAIVGIFNQKNNHGWVDKVEVVRSGGNEQTDEEIKKRYQAEKEIIDIS